MWNVDNVGVETMADNSRSMVTAVVASGDTCSLLLRDRWWRDEPYQGRDGSDQVCSQADEGRDKKAFISVVSDGRGRMDDDEMMTCHMCSSWIWKCFRIRLPHLSER